ncbi:hypothetical protein L596_012867 [Steinernema carpocapsae]|uniref:Uncharacterized protein n=1 Tax=Steinernema carpocapsae TaxID=34508 RepID=A0A4U5NYD3_STECR|nr:hypothetical protein L596_012867 [Steinernema carpocapsae]
MPIGSALPEGRSTECPGLLWHSDAADPASGAACQSDDFKISARCNACFWPTRGRVYSHKSPLEDTWMRAQEFAQPTLFQSITLSKTRFFVAFVFAAIYSVSPTLSYFEKNGVL